MKILKELTEYSASEMEIQEVEDAIAKTGYWEERTEWRIATTRICRIEPQIIDGNNWFITTIKCEQEIMIPAATIQKAIVFKKCYEDFQMELFFSKGWASSNNN